MDCKVTLTANAGVIVGMGGTSILIDVFHSTFASGFSSLMKGRNSHNIETKTDIVNNTMSTFVIIIPMHYSLSI